MHPPTSPQRRTLPFLVLGWFMMAQACQSNSQHSAPPPNQPRTELAIPQAPTQPAPTTPKPAPIKARSFPPEVSATNQQCIQCHPSQFNSFKTTSHFESIKTHYETPVPDALLPATRTTKPIHERGGYFAFETRDNKTYLIEFDHKSTEIDRASVDITIGNMGYFGMSYGTYNPAEDRYYRLPIERFRDMPIIGLSFPDKSAVHLRNKQPIMKSGSCVFCHGHVTKANDSMIANGLQCTTCHYNFQGHINEKTNSLKKVPASGAINPHTLSVVHQKNLCSACHSNALIEAQRENMAMQFSPDFLKTLGGRVVQADYGNNPHGSSANQIEATKCGIKDKGLSCLSCHSIHQPNTTRAQSLKVCISCHETVHSNQEQTVVRARCLECHMQKEAMPYDPTGFFFEPAEIPKLLNHDIKVVPSAQW